MSGGDRYYLMYLDPLGPELYYYSSPASLGARSSREPSAGSVPNAAADRSLHDLGNPEPFSYERSLDGVTFKIQGNRYRLKE